MELKQIFREKRFWVATFLIAWATALQGHISWLKKQTDFQEKFGLLEEKENAKKKEDSSSNDSTKLTETDFVEEVN